MNSYTIVSLDRLYYVKAASHRINWRGHLILFDDYYSVPIAAFKQWTSWVIDNRSHP